MVRDLYPICRTCHKGIEFEGTRKRPLEEAMELFTYILNDKKLLKRLRQRPI